MNVTFDGRRAARGRRFALLVAAAFLVWFTMTRMVAWSRAAQQLHSARYALICLLEATRQLQAHNTRLAISLVRAASRAVGRGPTATLRQIPALETAALRAVERGPGAAHALILTWLVAVASIIALFLWRDRTVTRLRAEQKLLRDKLLVISGGWMLATVKPGSVKDVVAGILAQVVKFTSIDAVEVLAVCEDRTYALAPYCASSVSLLRDHRLVPRALLDSPGGAVMRVMQTREPFYSGERGELGSVLPGVRLRRVAIYPLAHGDTVWGVVVLRGQSANWHTHLEDLITIIAKELAVLLAYARIEEDADQAARFQDLARVRSELLANVSHELRTPLGLIRGYTETLLYQGKQLQSEDLRDFLTVIADESAQLEGQIDKLLRMATMDTPGANDARARFSCETWAARLRRRVAPEGRVSLRDEIAPGSTLFGNFEDLLDAASNLVENALKYSPGPVAVELAATDAVFRVTVRDAGDGVPDRDLDRIFERFYRSPLHAQSDKRGSGLGLSIVQSIVQAHAGHLWARNRAGGFEVGFAIPARLAPYALPESSSGSGRRAAGRATGEDAATGGDATTGGADQ